MGDSKKGENVRAFFPVTTKSYLTLLSLYISRSSQHKNGTHFNREHCRRVGQADGVFDQTVRSRSFREISEMLCFFTRSLVTRDNIRARALGRRGRDARGSARARSADASKVCAPRSVRILRV